MTNNMPENSILADKHQAFTIAASPAADTIDTSDRSIPGLLRHYEYPVSVWPVIITPQQARELAELTIILPRLQARIPALYFNDDVQRLADFYFGGNEQLTEFALLCHNKYVDIGCRLDLTLTADGFKVLEVNIGTSIGGWQVHSFEGLIRRLHAPLSDNSTAGDFESRNTQILYIKFLVDKILQYVSGVDAQVNVFIEVGNAQHEPSRKNASAFFNDLLRRELKSRGLSGGAYVGPVDALSIGEDGSVRLNDRTIHAVLALGTDFGRLSPLLLRPFIMDKVYFPDHIGGVLQKNKANLAILRTLAAAGKFSARENELVLAHIPWTEIVSDGEVAFEGRTCRLLPMLRANRAGFVIKAATGFQGKDVFVGKFMDDQSWEEAIMLALETKAFIVQEFSDSLDFSAPAPGSGWGPHKLIWGAFGFGDIYGGVWVRMSSQRTNTGVINSATGAVEAIVFESK